MASRIIHDDWLNQNRNRRYPLFDEATLVDTTGTMAIPDDLIADLVFPVHPLDYDMTLFHVAQITVFSGGVIISLGYNGTVIATRTVTDAEHIENATYYIEGRGDFADSVGRIAIGSLQTIKQYGGTYIFSTANARLLPTVLRPSLKGVSGIRVAGADGQLSETLQGDIELVPGSNIQFEITAGAQPQLRISAVNNPDYEVGCDCPDTAPAECIKTINGIPPDPMGDFTLDAEGCLVIDGITNGLRLTDSCAEPCCGCEETEALRTEIQRLGTQIATQLSFANGLQSSVSQLRDVILTSKLGTLTGCG